MERKKTDCVIIGGGPGGYPAAIRLAQGGKKVIIIEATDVGGTCLNRGCIPTKSYLAHAAAYRTIKEADTWGLAVKDVCFDWKAIKTKKDGVVKKLRTGLSSILRSYGIEVIQGYGSFISPKVVQVSLQGKVVSEVEASFFIIATGSEPKELPAFPFDGTSIHSSTTLLDVESIPETLLIVGGGVIGCEFATIFAEYGTKVHIVEALDRILPLECENVSKAITKALQEKGVECTTKTTVQSIKKAKKGIVAVLGNSKELSFSCALLCVGRKLNSDGIGLDRAGVAIDKGAIRVDDTMKTNVSHIWAIGDVVGKTMYAHSATHQGLVAADNILGHSARMRYDAVPGVIFTHPEVGSVGLSLEGAKKAGYDVSLTSYALQSLGKAQASQLTSGFAQVVVEKKTGRILGAQVVGEDADILIAQMTLAMENELTIECISETIHAHPTLSEVWLEAALLAQGKPLHVPRSL